MEMIICSENLSDESKVFFVKIYDEVSGDEIIKFDCKSEEHAIELCSALELNTVHF